MRVLRLFASALLVISIATGSISTCFVISVENSYWFDARGVLFRSFDRTEWLALATWSAVGFLLASLTGILSALGLFVAARWSRPAVLSSLVVSAGIGALDWRYAGTRLEVLEVIAVIAVGVFSWWFLYRFPPVSSTFVARQRGSALEAAVPPSA